VEGFTNLLWTLMLAVALRLGIDAEVASMLGGLLSFTLLLGVLLRAHLGAREAAGITAFTLPVGVLLAVGSSAMLDFATSVSYPSVFSLELSRVGDHFERTRLSNILPHREANWVSARDANCAKRPGQDTAAR
jgi:hypothetical protein